MKPNDQRNFVHKRIIGGLIGAVTGGPAAAVAGFVQGGSSRSGGQPVAPLSRARIREISLAMRAANQRGDTQQGRAFRRELMGNAPIFGRGGSNIVARSCDPPLQMDQNGQCVFPGSPGDVSVGGAMPVMGQFGAGMPPMHRTTTVRECLPGMVLGKDGNCYNKGSITNKARMYPRGTRPLGTPGEMAALRKAAAFGRRMEGAVKRMQKIGVLKKPSRRSAPPARAQRLLGPGVVQIQQE